MHTLVTRKPRTPEKSRVRGSSVFILPSPQKQQEIVDYISEVRRKIATLQLQIPLHSQRAKKEFEEAVFGEAQKRIY